MSVTHKRIVHEFEWGRNDERAQRLRNGQDILVMVGVDSNGNPYFQEGDTAKIIPPPVEGTTGEYPITQVQEGGDAFVALLIEARPRRMPDPLNTLADVAYALEVLTTTWRNAPVIVSEEYQVYRMTKEVIDNMVVTLRDCADVLRRLEPGKKLTELSETITYRHLEEAMIATGLFATDPPTIFELDHRAYPPEFGNPPVPEITGTIAIKGTGIDGKLYGMWVWVNREGAIVDAPHEYPYDLIHNLDPLQRKQGWTAI